MERRMTIAARKVDAKWEAAQVADSKFQRAYLCSSLEEVIQKAVPFLSTATKDDTNVVIEIVIVEPEKA